jgi:5-methylcytosine-specific restriction endonuclease McrA
MQCRTCNEEKDVGLFYIRKSSGRPNLDCKVCHNARASAWASANREKVRGYIRKSCKRAYDKNPEKGRAKARAFRLKDPEAHKARVARSYYKMALNLTDAERERRKRNNEAWAKNNPEKVKEASRRNKKVNPEKHCFQQSQRRATKANACPPWLSAIQKAQIQEFYDIASALTTQTGIAHDVDHIHPLKGNGFNGLHVPWNLQVLSASENRSKSNKLMEY